MTPDELTAIRARRRKMFILSDAEQDALLAEVDRLTADLAERVNDLMRLASRAADDNATMVRLREDWSHETVERLRATERERARILAAVEALPNIRGEYWPDPLVDRAAVIAAIKGETT